LGIKCLEHDHEQTSMRPTRALLIYTVVVFVGGALLAPWLYQLVQAVAPGSQLAQSPFHRYLDRAFLGLALIGIWPLLRALGATSWREAGFVKPRGQWKRVAAGFALGFGSLACVAGIVLAAHGREVRHELTAAQVGGKAGAAMGTAVVVAVLEELLFRGAILGGLRRVWNWRGALVVSSMIYAIVHFLGKTDLTGPVTWMSGLELLPKKLEGFGELRVVIPGFFNLTLAGMMLGFAYQKTGNLYFSIGLHAGWIFWLKSYDIFTVTAAGSSTWLWGTGKLIDGWLALAVLGAAFGILAWLTPRKAEIEP
jgi:membrane protease YdiL (CAAX protease family)